MANQQTGELIPIDTKNDLNEMEEAVLTEILIPGEDDEDVEDFRERYFSSFQDESFGGNRADYIARVGEIDGVGGVKVYRCWNGGYHPSQLIPEEGVTEWFENQSGETLGEPVYAWLKRVYDAASEKKLTVGGTVQIEITNAEYKSPSQTLIRLVQETLDPEQSAGEGDGTAPIGHVVRVSGVKERPISITLQGIEYKSGYTFDNRKEEVESAIDRYFFQLRQEWAQEDRLVIRISQIEHHLMEIEGILDIGQTLLNEKAENVILQSDEIPVRGEVNG
jgi:uncharacterized phage protein gp47/JayE